MAEGYGEPQIIFLMATIILHSSNLLLWNSFGIYEEGGGDGDITSLFYVFSFYSGGEGEMRDVI